MGYISMKRPFMHPCFDCNIIQTIKKFSTKLSAAAGSVYLTADQGVWGSPEESNKLYNNLYEIIPGLKTFREEYCTER
ncbi:hypothetical protein Anas_10396 [Armadillidium nasatum]|uniref:MICOS complex subunit MIC13 n=1 Tax=Armadillidium nasatum TaxID=96803 RepID=A0A5N5TGQ6_9CRUS|nr:hypothetical protein Anas_10396 [Armadillidium nasatum]